MPQWAHWGRVPLGHCFWGHLFLGTPTFCMMKRKYVFGDTYFLHDEKEVLGGNIRC